MARIVTDYLDETVQRFPDKVAFVDERRSMTFSELHDEALHIAQALVSGGYFKQPVLVYLEKSPEVVAAFSGISYSGNFYSPIDTEMPAERIAKIVDRLQPVAVITDEAHRAEASEMAAGATVVTYESALALEVDRDAIRRATNRVIDSDVLYVLFTSGSTGTPKGAIISHRGIVDLSEWIAADLGFTSETVFGNQSPFYFSFSVYEIYQTLRNGSTAFIVPHALFSQPARLMRYLEDNAVDTVIWVPSILTFISTLKALDRPHLTHIRNIFFGAEAFQVKHLNRWMDEYPDARFVNLFGPTEVTDTCTWYEVDRRFEEGDLLPIGRSCTNKDCFLLDDDRLVTKPGELGEICMRGSGVAYGYYHDPERTAEAFVQNPLNDAYAETIYRTGDLGRYNERGELVYVCRKDFQVKHRGRRIELGEIETAASAVEGVDDCCCLYDNERLRIVLFYTGACEGRALTESLRECLPDYMVPGRRVHLDEMPHNLNGKVDRQALKRIVEEG